ncbi:DegT/DnrJ/EryC1/StrS family aminotransferase [Flavobacterium sp.]|jgi:CDP-6-deoxy-D-xylo-4-hexulose-3-dehydrase|uniref:DegT/DnrJ/EryC1/StrS family aminotransferase n=1 Tax=Flavobacterium sp. TaxID=239 RepID=UPI0037BF0FE4
MIKLAENTISQEELIALSKWIPETQQLTKGPLVLEFEHKFANYIGTKHCVMVNSGSSANLLMAYALLEGDYLKNKKVVVPAISWITTLSPFLQFGFEVFLCDSNSKNLGLDTEKLEELFIKEKPSLLILVHVLAHLNNMDEIHRICQKYDVIVIEDACEALGTRHLNGKKAGNLSLAGSFSFYYGHHISTIEGGAVTTNDTKLYNLMLSIRSHGWSRDVDQSYKESWKEQFNIDSVREYYTFYYPGFNLRSTDLNAFIGISQLDKMKQICKVREENYNFYNQYLENKFWKQESEYSELSSFAYGTIVENREEVFNYLKANNIEVRPLICGSMGKQPFWIKKYGQTSLEVADIIHDYGLYLPNHLYLDEEKIKFVCEKFKEVAIPKFF